MSLEQWSSKGWLVAHRTSPQEVADLLRLMDRDLGDCRASGLSPDWRLNISCNAALQSAKAALAACGYRASREAQHMRIVGSLAFAAGMKPADIQQLDMFRRKRNISDYERSGEVSAGEADEMVELAERIRQLVLEWLTKNHPELISLYQQ
ncbi:MAG: hypothetical protein FJY85_18005 [Deltaproteobacteria bacterium]|nr:hypothetical protein [Deltaproteobacteria bacterium]